MKKKFNKRALVLLPNLMSQEHSWEDYFPKNFINVIESLDGLVAESEKGARKYLLHFLDRDNMNKIPVRMLNEHTTEEELQELFKILSKEERWGVISDCGLTCIADPGSLLVYEAHKQNVFVEAYSGPSSIVMALMLSGFSGQNFSFLGYLPREKDLLINKLKNIESLSRNDSSVYLWIEAPYRCEKMLDILLFTLKDSTELCVACDLTLSTEEVIVKSMSKWKKEKRGSFHKRPCVFALRAKQYSK